MEKWATEKLRCLANVDKEKAEKLQKEYEYKNNIKIHNRMIQRQLNLEYRYFRWSINSGNKWYEVSVCFGWKLSSDHNDIEYSYTVQSKNDKFSRKIARNILNERFFNKKTHYVHNAVRNIPILIALHYNDIVNKKVPEYARRIPLGGYDYA